MTSAYPIADEVLVEKVRALAAELGAWPSKRRVMRTAGVGAPRASAALDALRADGFDPAPSRSLSAVPDAAGPRTEEHQEQPDDIARGVAEDAPERGGEAVSEPADSAVEALVSGAAGAVTAERDHSVPRWPLLIIAAGAFVAVWSGWVGLGRLAGFGPVVLLPGIADEWVINSAITLPLGVEAYAAFALWAWLSSAPVSERARTFARWSALGSLALGAAGQVAYHLLTAAGVERAPWPITAGVSVLPVVVLGCAAALVHLLHVGGRDAGR